jgi:ATP-binding cassette subfamily F protein 3
MSLLAANALAFAHPGRATRLFDNVSFEIGPGDRIGLVGPNGAGKSTLLRLVTGELTPDAGRFVRRRDLTLAYVPQEHAALPDVTILQHALDADPLLAALRRELAGAAELRYAELLDAYMEADGYGQEARAERILAGLGFDARERELPLAHASAGQRTRAALARLLLAPADLVLLDEPTNHLDLGARAWLAEHLASRPHAFMLVSHDRAFLQAATTRVFELRDGTLTRYEGDYAFFREARALAERQAWERFHAQERRAAAAERAARQRDELARKVGTMPPGGSAAARPFYEAMAGRISRTARILRERPLREERAEKPRVLDPIPTLDFGQVPRLGDVAVALRGASKRYGGRTLFEELTLDVARGERLAITGPNGAGKTTLLKLLVGLVPPDAGEVRLDARAKVGYFAQEAENLDPAASALAILGALEPDRTRVQTLLACLRLRGERAHEPVGQMSAGERAKVAIARLLAMGCNMLVLDEPTNHLDLDAREAVEATLADFPGTIVFTSHDRVFTDALASATLALGG